MKIQQADTYQYEMKHFNKLLGMDKGVAGECFKNVKQFCKEYQSAGRKTSISLVIGMKSWDSGEVTMCYHYLVKDDETGEYTDPQYWRYTFIELHNWTLEDYTKECDRFEDEHDYHPAQEFFTWYCFNGFGKTIENSVKLIKSLSDFRVKISDKAIECYCRDGYDDCQPKFGNRIIEKLRID
jgi:hypothetical protein